MRTILRWFIITIPLLSSCEELYSNEHAASFSDILDWDGNPFKRRLSSKVEFVFNDESDDEISNISGNLDKSLLRDTLLPLLSKLNTELETVRNTHDNNIALSEKLNRSRRFISAGKVMMLNLSQKNEDDFDFFPEVAKLIDEMMFSILDLKLSKRPDYLSELKSTWKQLMILIGELKSGHKTEFEIITSLLKKLKEVDGLGNNLGKSWKSIQFGLINSLLDDVTQILRNCQASLLLPLQNIASRLRDIVVDLQIENSMTVLPIFGFNFKVIQEYALRLHNFATQITECKENDILHASDAIAEKIIQGETVIKDYEKHIGNLSLMQLKNLRNQFLELLTILRYPIIKAQHQKRTDFIEFFKNNRLIVQLYDYFSTFAQTDKDLSHDFLDQLCENFQIFFNQALTASLVNLTNFIQERPIYLSASLREIQSFLGNYSEGDSVLFFNMIHFSDMAQRLITLLNNKSLLESSHLDEIKLCFSELHKMALEIRSSKQLLALRELRKVLAVILRIKKSTDGDQKKKSIKKVKDELVVAPVISSGEENALLIRVKKLIVILSNFSYLREITVNDPLFSEVDLLIQYLQRSYHEHELSKPSIKRDSAYKTSCEIIERNYSRFIEWKNKKIF